jgi:polyhydroxyalkanoate synthesis regulator phasin
MTATKRTPKKTPERKGKKRPSDFYVVRSAQEAVETLSGKIESYGQRYVRKPLQTGRHFASDLRKDPRKAVEEVFDDSQRFVKGLGRDTRRKVEEVFDGGKKFARDFNRDPRKAVDGLVDDGREYLDDFREETQEKVDELVAKGRELVRGVEKDMRRLLEDLSDTSKKLVDRITLREAIEKRVREELEALPKQMKLASKKDVLSLSAAVKALTARVEELSRQGRPAPAGEPEPAPKTSE